MFPKVFLVSLEYPEFSRVFLMFPRGFLGVEFAGRVAFHI